MYGKNTLHQCVECFYVFGISTLSKNSTFISFENGKTACLCEFKCQEYDFHELNALRKWF